MKHKEKECTWAPGMQDTDVTFAGEYTWAEIKRARDEMAGQQAPDAPKGLFIVLGLGVLALVFGGWLIY